MALWVLAGHSLGAMGVLLPPITHPGSAVDIFMLISGFLMAYHFRVREDKESWESPLVWRNFYIRRFFRIAPAYYLILLIALIFRNDLRSCEYYALTTIPHPPQSDLLKFLPAATPLAWADVLTHLSFTFGFFPKYAVTSVLPDWSIGLEMQFYMALPFIMLLYRRAGHFFATLLLIAVWIAATHFIGFGPSGSPKPFGFFPMATFLPLKLNCFVVGILLAESYHFKDRNRSKSALLCLLGLLLVRVTFDKYAIIIGFLCALLLIYRGDSAPAAVRKPLGWARGILGSRFSVFLADTSYSVYLFHLLVLWPFSAWLALQPSFLRLPAGQRASLLVGMVVLVAYPVAYLLHRYVEQPGIQLGKRFIRPAGQERRVLISPVPLPEATIEAVPQ